MTCAVSSCKILLSTSPGGEIVSNSGLYDCGENIHCELLIEEGQQFNETFSARPLPGYIFTGWGEGWCRGSIASCKLTDSTGSLTALGLDTALIANFQSVNESDCPDSDVRADRCHMIKNADVLVKDLRRTTLFRSSSSDLASLGFQNTKHSEWSPGYVYFENMEVLQPKYCVIQISGGELESLNPNIASVPNDYIFEAIAPCQSLSGVGGGIVANRVTGAIIDVLELHQPLHNYANNLDVILDDIASHVMRDQSADRNGDGLISYSEMTQAKPASFKNIKETDVYTASRNAIKRHVPGSRKPAPNIILIVADDMGYGDLSFFGHEEGIPTPNIDRIAAQGIAFDNFHVNPLCSATRASLLTGQFSFHARGSKAGPAIGGANQGATLIPEFLQQAGYRTGAFGKWHLSKDADNLPMNRGFSRWFGFDQPAIPYDLADSGSPEAGRFFDDWALAQEKQGHVTDVLVDQSIKFIESNSESAFFVYLSFNAVHRPYRMTESESPSAPTEWLERVISDGVEEGYERQDYVALIRHMDSRIGDLLDALEDSGRSQDTLVMFTSDNGAESPQTQVLDGPGSNGGYRDGKASTFEGGIRVPLFARWPAEIPPGQVNSEFTAVFDIWPTLHDVAGLFPRQINGKHKLNGESLLPLMQGKASLSGTERAFIFSAATNNAVVIPPYKYVRSFGVRGLFNLEEDPFERVDLSESLPEVVEEILEAAAILRGS